MPFSLPTPGPQPLPARGRRKGPSPGSRCSAIPQPSWGGSPGHHLEISTFVEPQRVPVSEEETNRQLGLQGHQRSLIQPPPSSQEKKNLPKVRGREPEGQLSCLGFEMLMVGTSGSGQWPVGNRQDSEEGFM